MSLRCCAYSYVIEMQTQQPTTGIGCCVCFCRSGATIHVVLACSGIAALPHIQLALRQHHMYFPIYFCCPLCCLLHILAPFLLNHGAVGCVSTMRCAVYASHDVLLTGSGNEAEWGDEAAWHGGPRGFPLHLLYGVPHRLCSLCIHIWLA